MACSNQQYFVGNGEVLIRAIGDDCGAPEEAFRKVGDANELMITISQDFGNHYESRTGNRTRAARWLNQTEANFSMSVQNFSAENLATLFLGENTGAVTAGSVTDEAINVPSLGWVFTEYPGISNVVVTTNGGLVTLTLGTDYNLDERNGGIEIIDLTNIVNNQIEVDYSYVGIEGLIKALTTQSQDYEVRFNGINLNAPNKPVIVTLHRAQFSAAEEFSLIGQDITSLSFTGALLPDANGEFFTTVLSNQIV